MSNLSKDLSVEVQNEVKAVSKIMGKSISQAGYKVPHGVLLHAVSAALQQRNWHQLKAAVATAATTMVTAVAAPAKLPQEAAQPLPRLADLQGPEVPARFYTDDRVFEVSFDARTYLVTATDEQLSAIYSVGFTGDYCTDAIAENLAQNWQHEGGGDDVAGAFKYLESRNQGRDSIGFECKVEGEAFLRWLDACRPQVAAKLLCNECGVVIAASPLEKYPGLWTWAFEGKSSDIWLSSREEAELDAYSSCNLLQEAVNDLCA